MELLHQPITSAMNVQINVKKSVMQCNDEIKLFLTDTFMS